MAYSDKFNTPEHRAYRLKGIKEGIAGTERAIAKNKKAKAPKIVMDAHDDQLRHYTKLLKEMEDEKSTNIK